MRSAHAVHSPRPAAYGVDADRNGDAAPHNAADAIHRAANQLRASGAPDDWHKALVTQGRQPYRRGGGHAFGTTEKGLDCSGAVRWLLTLTGYNDPGGIVSGSFINTNPTAGFIASHPSGL